MYSFRPQTPLRLCMTAGILALAAVQVANAQVRYVDDDGPLTGNDGLSWATAYRDLQQALAEAAGSGGAITEIRVAQGLYRPAGSGGPRSAAFVMLNGVAIKGGYAGIGQPNPDLRNPATQVSTLSGDLNGNDGPGFSGTGENSYHVVNASNKGATAILDGFVISGGNANGGSPDDRGGGILNSGSGSPPALGPTISNCVIAANQASFGGGMIVINGVTATVSGCAFAGNSASQGGAIYAESPPSGPGTTLTNCIFRANSATDGGGVYARQRVTIIGCVFSGNTASDGGGLYTIAVASAFSMVNSSFSGNSAGRGGAIHNTFGGPSNFPVYDNCVVWNNTATISGSEVFNFSSTPIYRYSLVKGSGGSSAWNSGFGLDFGGNLDVDPMFVDADGTDNTFGTSDDNLRLQAGSPAIDSGNNTLVPSGVTTDADGQPRFVDDCSAPNTGVGPGPIVDRGAYERASGASGPPSISVCAASQNINANAACQATVPSLTGQVVATGCGTITVTQSPLAGTTIGLGPTTVTLTATDSASQSSTCQATITVIDATGPTISTCASNPTLLVGPTCMQTIPDLTAQVVASDNCGGVTVTQSPAAGTAAGLGANPVVLTATDGANQTATCNATVTVVDQTPPVINVNTSPIVVTDVNCSGSEPVTLPSATATDNCNGSVPVSNNAPSLFPAGQTTTVTYTAQDSSGNPATATRSVTVKYGADVRVDAAVIRVGIGSRPALTTTPLSGVLVNAYSIATGSCARQQAGPSLNWQHYPAIVANCTPVGTATTSAAGTATLNLPPGKYILISQVDVNNDNHFDFITASIDNLQCHDNPILHLRMLVDARGRPLPAIISILTGTELLIIQPEVMTWDQPEQLYPFVFEADGEWGVTTTVTPPEGFVADYPSLSADVADTHDAVQFTITEVGSDLVPTQTVFDVTHKGKKRLVRKDVGIRLTRDYAISRGFDPDLLKKKGILVEPGATLPGSSAGKATAR